MLWKCGVKNRELSMKQGINSWRDERCNSKVLGFNENSQVGKIIDNIIRVNRDDDTNILPNTLSNKLLIEDDNEMFVDFDGLMILYGNKHQIPKNEI